MPEVIISTLTWLTGHTIGQRAGQRESRCESTLQGVFIYRPAIMSASTPPKDATDAEPGDPTPDKSSMERGDADGGAGTYSEFDVKEQDRWLPIANGKLTPFNPIVNPEAHRSASPAYHLSNHPVLLPAVPSDPSHRDAPSGTMAPGPGYTRAREREISPFELRPRRRGRQATGLHHPLCPVSLRHSGTRRSLLALKGGHPSSVMRPAVSERAPPPRPFAPRPAPRSLLAANHRRFRSPPSFQSAPLVTRAEHLRWPCRATCPLRLL